MDDYSVNTPEDLKFLILNSQEPLVFKQFLNWELLQWDLKKWNQLLKGEQLLFRCGKNSFTHEPQWERSTHNVSSTFQEFLTFSQKISDEWMYFDYKYLQEWLRGIEELHNKVDWSIFGFPELSSKDSTIWIGSKGAHTPCHIDTYGCNLIAQIYGKKQWLVFPPDENLKPSRIPYEESSIYSKLNFFSPLPHQFEGDAASKISASKFQRLLFKLKTRKYFFYIAPTLWEVIIFDFTNCVGNCRKIILNPGDVLLLPHKWWHYVENLETAISVNVWLPLPQDDLQRLSESLVQFFMSQITKEVQEAEKKIILNPNSDNDIAETDFRNSFNLINTCKRLCTSSSNSQQENCDKTAQERLSKIVNSYQYLNTIFKLSNEEFKDFIKTQSDRFSQKEPEVCRNNDVLHLIDALTHPDVISVMTNKLLNSG